MGNSLDDATMDEWDRSSAAVRNPDIAECRYPITDTHISAPPGEVYWRYEVPPHRGAKMLLLTLGCVAVVGDWTGEYGEQFIAWAPLPRRDKVAEAARHA